MEKTIESYKSRSRSRSLPSPKESESELERILSPLPKIYKNIAKERARAFFMDNKYVFKT